MGNDVGIRNRRDADGLDERTIVAHPLDSAWTTRAYLAAQVPIRLHFKPFSAHLRFFF
jgi:hypothetical protein